MVTPAQRREAVAHLETTHGMSERRACRVIGVDRSSAILGDVLPVGDSQASVRSQEFASQSPKLGFSGARRSRKLSGDRSNSAER